MKSLRIRLFVAAAVAVLGALLLSGLVLIRLFSDHVASREMAELRNHLNQIVAAIEVDGDGRIALASTPADPRFDTPQGGLYWQVEMPDGKIERSRSLWDYELSLPRDEISPGDMHQHELDGPAASKLMALEGAWTVGPREPPVRVRLAVAVDRRDVERAVADFSRVLWWSLAVLGLTLVLALVVQIQVGLRPLAQMRLALQRVQEGKDERIAGGFPSEVTPLVRDMNALLDRERSERQKARERAADLAHGFKTPLAVLSAVARELRGSAQERPAAEIDAQIDMMGRHVRRELARARTTGASAVVRRSVAMRPIFEKIVAALERISAERHIVWTIDVTGDPVFPGDENDLLELVGNLAENAAKWTRARVWLRAERSGGGLRIAVEDDGEGMTDDQRAAKLVRGRRLDETSDGTGLGLSIVAKMVEEYRGTIALERSEAGGLRVVVDLPD